MNSFERQKWQQVVVLWIGCAILVLFFFSSLFWERMDKLMLFPFAGIGCLIASIGLYRQYRLLRDLPTSRIASAAQGYVELVGRTGMLPGEPLLSPLGRQPCCWYSYSLSRKRRHDDGTEEWELAESGSSNDRPVLIVDETGVCAILPQEAGLSGHNTALIYTSTWIAGDTCKSESLLLPGIEIYAAGDLATASDAAEVGLPKIGRAEVAALIAQFRKDRDQPLEKRQEQADSAKVNSLIAAWKKDSKQLQERFDLDRDGTIDMKEWERARLEARREVQRRRGPRDVAPQRSASDPTVEGIPILRQPRDGRPFMLANAIPETVDKQLLVGGWVFLFFSLYCVAGFVLALK